MGPGVEFILHARNFEGRRGLELLLAYDAYYYVLYSPEDKARLVGCGKRDVVRSLCCKCDAPYWVRLGGGRSWHELMTPDQAKLPEHRVFKQSFKALKVRQHVIHSAPTSMLNPLVPFTYFIFTILFTYNFHLNSM